MFKYENLREGDRFLFPNDHAILAHRTKYEELPIKEWFKRIITGDTVTIINKRAPKDNYDGVRKMVYFNLRGESCMSKWGEFRKKVIYLGNINDVDNYQPQGI